MMETLFLRLLNTSIAAGWMVLAVILLRLLLKKAPKTIVCFLWAFVGIRLIYPFIRLIVPFSFKSIVSLIPSTETVPENIIYSQAPTINTGIPIINSALNPIISETFAPDPVTNTNPLEMITLIAAAVWLIGIAVMITYTLISYLRIHKKVVEGVAMEGNIWLCDRIETPFLLGVFRPRIFLPSSMNKGDIEYVIAHEKAHLRRRDYIWKPLGFLILTIYWFNPLLWIAYVLLCRDIELACDEKVIREMGIEYKKPYSNALINCSMQKRMISACPLAFGEVGVKDRIKAVLNYKKPAFWIIVLAVVLCVAAGVCLLTDPSDEDPSSAFQIHGETLEDGSRWFIATVLEVKNGKIAVKPFEDTFEANRFNDDAPLMVTTTTVSGEEITDLNVGDNIYIHYDGLIALSYPAQILKVYTISKHFMIPQGSSDYGTVSYDIDNDGKNETLIMGRGIHSGLFSFTLSVIEGGYPTHYSYYFTGSFSKVSFEKGDNGKYYVRGGEESEDHLYEIRIDNGRIILSGKGKSCEGGWLE